MNNLLNAYLKNNISDFKLKNLSDLYLIYGVDVCLINGYNDLTDAHKELFNTFIINYYNGYGLDNRATIIPQNIYYVEETSFCGKENNNDDYYILLETDIQIIKSDGLKYSLKNTKDELFNNLKCIKTECRQYLRFEYIINGHREWLHVISSVEWY